MELDASAKSALKREREAEQEQELLETVEEGGAKKKKKKTGLEIAEGFHTSEEMTKIGKEIKRQKAEAAKTAKTADVRKDKSGHRRTKTNVKDVYMIKTKDACLEAMNTRWYDGHLDEAPEPECLCRIMNRHGTHWTRMFNGCMPDHRTYDHGNGAHYLTHKTACESAMAEWRAGEKSEFLESMEGWHEPARYNDYDTSRLDDGYCHCNDEHWERAKNLCHDKPIPDIKKQEKKRRKEYLKRMQQYEEEMYDQTKELQDDYRREHGDQDDDLPLGEDPDEYGKDDHL